MLQNQSFNIDGVRLRIIVNSSFELFEMITEEKGQRPGLHFHCKMDEMFYIISGKICFTIDGRQHIAESGEYIIAPKGIAHSWSTYVNGLTKMLIIFSPSQNQAGYFSSLEKLNNQGVSWKEAIEELSEKFDNIPL